MSKLLDSDLLFHVEKPGQYLGNEWGAYRKSFDTSQVHLCLAFPDLYELGMSNFGQRILYQLVNERQEFLCDRTYAPGQDMEALLRHRDLALWGWESRQALAKFELLGFSLQYELTYTNVLNMLELAGVPIKQNERHELFPLVFGGGPSSVNPEPMAPFMDFFIIGDGEQALIDVMDVVLKFKVEEPGAASPAARERLLRNLANVAGVYVPSLYEERPDSACVKPKVEGIPERVLRQVSQLTDSNQPTAGLVPYLSLVHDRQVLEVRRGCDRGCRFCQPGYTFLPVRERSTDDLVRLSKEALGKSGYEEYSMLSLCVSDYTTLYESARALNQMHSSRRTNMSFPSQRADRMNMEMAEELKVVRKSGITLAPEAGTERLRAVINKGLSHAQIISAIESAYRSGWSSIKLYYMIGLPTETDEDLDGIVATLKEATELCRRIKREAGEEANMRGIEFTCTISNFVPKPFTPFQWFAQVLPAELARKQQYLRDQLRATGLRNVNLNGTNTQTSLLESAIGRGGRSAGELIYRAFRNGCTFDAWDEKLKAHAWHESAASLGMNLEDEATKERPVGSRQPWDVVHVGLADWWLVKEWEKALAVKETAPCTENTCHACGVCTELDTEHALAAPKPEVVKKNPFVKQLAVHVESDGDVHPSLFFEKPPEVPDNQVASRIRIEFCKKGDFKFISHLDLQHLLIRGARRANLTLAYTEGFSPSPKISIALSLPLFAEGGAELADIELADTPSPDELMTRLNQQLPAEIQISRARQVEKIAPSLASLVGRATYSARLIGSSCAEAGWKPAEERERLSQEIASLLGRDQIMVEQPLSEKTQKKKKSQGRRRHSGPAAEPQAQVKQKDLRPHIFQLALSESEPITIEFCISHGSRAHIKPADILKLLAPQSTWQITRTGLQTDDGRGIFQASV